MTMAGPGTAVRRLRLVPSAAAKLLFALVRGNTDHWRSDADADAHAHALVAIRSRQVVRPSEGHAVSGCPLSLAHILPPPVAGHGGGAAPETDWFLLPASKAGKLSINHSSKPQMRMA